MRRFSLPSIALLTVIVLNATVWSEPPRAKLPPPDADTQKETQADIRALYRADYTKKTAADLKALSSKLLKVGLETKGDNTSRFVLFLEARDVAAKAADPGLMLKAIVQMETEFAIDGVLLRTESLEVAGSVAALPSAHRAIAVTAMEASDIAVRADRYPEAVRLASVAAKTASKSKDDLLSKRASLRDKEVQEIALKYEFVKPLEARLKTDPKDAAAVRAVGQFRCLLKGDWDAGLPLVAQGAEGKIRELARQDLASPKSAEERRSLADGYWELAQNEKGAAASQLRRRACHYYRIALPDLGGLAQERTKRRLEEFEPPGPWDHLDLGNAEIIDDFVRMPAGLISTKEEFSGPVEVKLIVRLPANDIRLVGPSGSVVIFNWGDNPQELRLTRPDGNNEKWESGSLMRAPTKSLKLDTWYTIRWKLTATEFTVWVNDKIVFSEKGKYSLTAKAPMRLSTVPNSVDVKSFTARSVR